jgi:hypothetical protein
MTTIRITIGPLPSAWVRKWAVDASESMRRVSIRSVPMPFAVGDDFFARNLALVGEWMAAASESATHDAAFVWSGEDDADIVLNTVQYWRNLAQVRHDLVVRGEAPAMDPDAERFTQAVRRSMLDALVCAGRLTAEYAHRLEASWPRLSATGDRDVAQDERDASGAAR